MFMVITKDAQGAPAFAYRGPNKDKAEWHKQRLLAEGSAAIIEEAPDEDA